MGNSIENKIKSLPRAEKKVKLLKTTRFFLCFSPQNYPSMAEKRQRSVLAQHLPHNGL